MNITKNEMARVVIQALYAMPQLPAADDRRVVKSARQTVSTLATKHRLALKIINDGIAAGAWPTKQ